MATTTARRRLDPLVRRDLILDVAARTVAEEGVSAVSMERLGRDAGISKALVYNYFPNRNALLSELLVREYRVFQGEARQAKEGIDDFPTLVRVTTRAYLRHVAARGVLIQRLMNEPAVSAAIRSVDQEGRQLTVAFFASEIAKFHGLDLKVSAMAADLLMGLTGAAGDYLCRTGAQIEELEDVVVGMIMAALAQLPAKGA
ncbi:MAG TPA: TetR/AcrR family transcriptional regulator [Allosphingosinicella sp.]|jgi:AcrR family transcriptional regulator|nr:TetR/AcrR family transcriptional regulator [Allosphingosinicella sp.]